MTYSCCSRKKKQQSTSRLKYLIDHFLSYGRIVGQISFDGSYPGLNFNESKKLRIWSKMVMCISGCLFCLNFITTLYKDHGDTISILYSVVRDLLFYFVEVSSMMGMRKLPKLLVQLSKIRTALPEVANFKWTRSRLIEFMLSLGTLMMVFYFIKDITKGIMKLPDYWSFAHHLLRTPQIPFSYVVAICHPALSYSLMFFLGDVQRLSLIYLRKFCEKNNLIDTGVFKTEVSMKKTSKIKLVKPVTPKDVNQKVFDPGLTKSIEAVLREQEILLHEVETAVNMFLECFSKVIVLLSGEKHISLEIFQRQSLYCSVMYKFNLHCYRVL